MKYSKTSKRGSVHLDKVRYSIDKIKLHFKYIKSEKINSFLQELGCCNFDKYYESNQITKCKHNFLFGDGDGVVYVGVVPNWIKEERFDKDIILEYNPNKVNPFLIKELSWLLHHNKACIDVMSIDFAIDFRLPYKYFRMLKRDKREYMCSIGHSEVETQYLGALGHNHIKLYDKAKEQKLKDIDWTRLEITCKEIKSLSSQLKDFYCMSFPGLLIVNTDINFDILQLSDITRIVLESIIQDVSVLYTIKKYDTRKKYEQLLFDFFNSYQVDINCLYKLYTNFVEIFNNNTEITSFMDFNLLLEKSSNTRFL